MITKYRFYPTEDAPATTIEDLFLNHNIEQILRYELARKKSIKLQMSCRVIMYKPLNNDAGTRNMEQIDPSFTNKVVPLFVGSLHGDGLSGVIDRQRQELVDRAYEFEKGQQSGWVLHHVEFSEISVTQGAMIYDGPRESH